MPQYRINSKNSKYHNQIQNCFCFIAKIGVKRLTTDDLVQYIHNDTVCIFICCYAIKLNNNEFKIKFFFYIFYDL